MRVNGCGSGDFLISPLELLIEEKALDCFPMLFVMLGWQVVAERPSCRLCRILKIGLKRLREGDRGKEAVGTWKVQVILLNGSLAALCWLGT